MKRFRFTNPCKTCLVQPCCDPKRYYNPFVDRKINITCEELEKYERWKEITYILEDRFVMTIIIVLILMAIVHTIGHNAG